MSISIFSYQTYKDFYNSKEELIDKNALSKLKDSDLINNSNSKKLSDMPAIDLSKGSESNTKTASELLGGKEIKFDSKFFFSEEGQKQAMEKMAMEGRSRAVFNGVDGKPIDYCEFGFQAAVNGMTELSDEQKATLRNAIIASTETNKTSQESCDTYGMRICQTGVELKVISKNLVPEKYQKNFNELVDQYTKGLSDKYVNSIKSIAELLKNRPGNEDYQIEFRQTGQEMLEDLQNGNHIFQTALNSYKEVFSSIDMTNGDTLKKSLEAVYDKIINNGGSYTKGSSNRADLIEEVGYLRNKWNDVMSEMKDCQDNKFVTSINLQG